jgi:TatD DNase family protein
LSFNQGLIFPETKVCEQGNIDESASLALGEWMSEWIDSHCHLEKPARTGQLKELLERAETAGVRRRITVGTRPDDWHLYRKLATEHQGRIFWTAGLHPCSVDEGWEEALLELPSYWATPPYPVALGEIGLDYFHLPKYPDEAAEMRQQQEGAFRTQLQIALQLDCPVIIHSRNAYEPTLRMIDESGVDWKKVVFHCWSEGAEAIRQLNQRGGRASFTGIVTYKNAENVREAALAQGIDTLMVETDAPYLSPEPHRGKANEPAWVVRTGEALAQLLEVSPEVLAARTTANTADFFGLQDF